MFCQRCGNQIPDGASFCTACGNVVGAPAAPAATPTKPVSKREYFSKVAPMGQRIKRYIALALGLACILTVFLAANNMVNGSIFELPILSVFDLGEGGSQLQKELDDAIELMEEDDDCGEITSFLGDIMSEGDFDSDDVEDVSKELADLCRPLSMNSIVEIGELLDAEDTELITGYKTIISVVWIGAVILMALTGLGVLFQKTWLMVLSYILGMGFVAFTGGFTFWLTATILYIVTAVLFSKLKFDYKVYKASCKAGR